MMLMLDALPVIVFAMVIVFLPLLSGGPSKPPSHTRQRQ
jgi:hypothetical protein